MKILRSKGKTFYRNIEAPTAAEIEEIRKQSPIGVVIEVVTIGSDWQSKYKEAIGLLLPVERIETLSSTGLPHTKYFVVNMYHKWYGHWCGEYVKEV